MTSKAYFFFPAGVGGKRCDAWNKVFTDEVAPPPPSTPNTNILRKRGEIESLPTMAEIKNFFWGTNVLSNITRKTLKHFIFCSELNIRLWRNYNVVNVQEKCIKNDIKM